MYRVEYLLDLRDSVAHLLDFRWLEHVHHTDIVREGIDAFFEGQGGPEHCAAVRGHGLHSQELVYRGVGNVGTQLEQQGLLIPGQPCIFFENMVARQVDVEGVGSQDRVTPIREGIGGLVRHIGHAPAPVPYRCPASPHQKAR